MDVKEYLARIGLEMPETVVPDSAFLKKLQFAHCTSVPYENIDMMRGIPTSLDPEALYQKIVVNRRGGLCFELNGAFGELLRQLGYGVTDYAARYLRGETTIPMRRHRVLVVQALDGLWLCDVGIGEICPRLPVAMLTGVAQEQLGERYRFVKDLDLGWVLQDFYKGAWRNFYSFTEEPQLVVDYEAPNFYCEKHSDSPFNKQEMFSLKTGEGRITLDGHIYKEFKSDRVEVRELTDAEMPWAYAQFGLPY